ncbi:MAG: outer membrane lipoprotein carrier protein, partial [Pseudohongiellaceae bacterium]
MATGQVIKQMNRSLHKIASPSKGLFKGLFKGLVKGLSTPLFTLVLATNSWSGGAVEDIQKLRDLLQPITSLSAHFEQQIRDADGYELQASQGLFQVSQP